MTVFLSNSGMGKIFESKSPMVRLNILCPFCVSSLTFVFRFRISEPPRFWDKTEVLIV